MESTERFEKRLDARVGRPGKSERGERDSEYHKLVKAGIKIGKLVLKERAHRKRVAFGAVKRALREAGWQMRIKPGYDSNVPCICYCNETDYLSRKEQRKAKAERRRKYPSTDVIEPSEPTAWNTLPEQAVEKVVCYTGDRRILVEVHVVLIRLDRPWRKEYPPDWKWYPTPGPVKYMYFSWQEQPPVWKSFERVDDVDRLIRELHQEMQKESAKKSRQEERRRVNRRNSGDDESDEEGAFNDGADSGSDSDEEEEEEENSYHDSDDGVVPP